LLDSIDRLRALIDERLEQSRVAVLPPLSASVSLPLLESMGYQAATVMLDPWYNKGVGGVRADYDDFIVALLDDAARVGAHVYLWGFPEIVAHFVDVSPAGAQFNAWLTWYYKNNPSVIRGWRSSQMACLHYSHPGAKMYPEHFLNEKQLDLKSRGKLRYMPGPTSVIEAALLVGFVGRKEQTGHPSQKPEAVYEPLVKMTTVEGDLVVDPMCGSGTTGAVCRSLNRLAIIADSEEEYLALAESRLGTERIPPEVVIAALSELSDGRVLDAESTSGVTQVAL